MSDFMLWLHKNYIKPQLEEVDRSDYEMDFSLVDTNLMESHKVHLRRMLTFTAIHAFTLGFRTAAGLRGELGGTQANT